jgi:phosphoribosylcarboxyaminoimidazole (NCAIR) mutase
MASVLRMLKMPDTMPVTTIVIGGFAVYTAGLAVLKKIKNKFTSLLVKNEDRLVLLSIMITFYPFFIINRDSTD